MCLFDSDAFSDKAVKKRRIKPLRIMCNGVFFGNTANERPKKINIRPHHGCFWDFFTFAVHFSKVHDNEFFLNFCGLTVSVNAAGIIRYFNL